MARRHTNRFDGLDLVDGQVVLRFTAGPGSWAFQLAPAVADQLLDAIRELSAERTGAAATAPPNSLIHKAPSGR